jgi:hypothetical protein
MHGILSQPGVYRDGSLGWAQPGAHRDGSLGRLQPGAYRDGSLGGAQPGAYRDGSLGCGCEAKAMSGLGSVVRLMPQAGLGALPISLDLVVGAAMVFGGLYYLDQKMGS